MNCLLLEFSIEHFQTAVDSRAAKTVKIETVDKGGLP